MSAHPLNPGDRVEYVGPPLPGSGDESLDVPDLLPGETGTVSGFEPPAGIVVSWDRAPSMVVGFDDVRPLESTE